MKHAATESIEIIRKAAFEAEINAETRASRYSITCLSYRYAAYGMRRAREDDGSLPGVENPGLVGVQLSQPEGLTGLEEGEHSPAIAIRITIENSDRIVIAMSRRETAIPLGWGAAQVGYGVVQSFRSSPSCKVQGPGATGSFAPGPKVLKLVSQAKLQFAIRCVCSSF